MTNNPIPQPKPFQPPNVKQQPQHTLSSNPNKRMPVIGPVAVNSILQVDFHIPQPSHPNDHIPEAAPSLTERGTLRPPFWVRIGHLESRSLP